MADPSFSRQRADDGSRPSLAGISVAQLGLYVTLVSLTMLFGASIIAYLVTRSQNELWHARPLPPLPWGLAASSALLVGVSVSMRWGIAALKRNAFTTLERALWISGALAVGFLLAQIQNWRSLLAAAVPVDVQPLYVFTVYALTALHALHVLAGFIPLGLVIARAHGRQYSSSRTEGVRLCAQCWDYLLVVWFVLLFVVMT